MGGFTLVAIALWITRISTDGAITLMVMHQNDVPDLDWYVDNVVVPGGMDREPIGPVRSWQASWEREARELAAAPGSPEHRRAIRLALHQGFVLTRAQTRDCGLSDAEVRGLVRRTSWAPAGHGVVSVLAPGCARDGASTHIIRRRSHALLSASAALRRSGHVISAASAAIVHGLPTMAIPDLPQLATTDPGTFGRRSAAQVRVARADTIVDDWFGAPVSPVAAAIVELARFDDRSGLMAADAALHERIIGPAAIHAELARATTLPGIRRARTVLSLASPLIESPLESITHLALFDSGLPMPMPQRWVEGADGVRYRVDFLWPDLRLILEADGRGKYVGDAGWREKKRELMLGRAGYRVARVIWSDIVDGWPATYRWLAELLGVNPLI